MKDDQIEQTSFLFLTLWLVLVDRCEYHRVSTIVLLFAVFPYYGLISYPFETSISLIS
jgi:hypothetical protein